MNLISWRQLILRDDLMLIEKLVENKCFDFRVVYEIYHVLLDAPPVRKILGVVTVLFWDLQALLESR